MINESFTAIESQVLSNLNQGINTFDSMMDNVQFGEKTLSQTLENLIARNIIKLDNKSKKYVYCTPLENNEMVILDGNLWLPTTVISVPEKGIKYVTRGAWYELPIDFDIRRIIWNTKLVGKNNSTLVEMIRTSVLKERKSKIKHNAEYDNIRGKVLPYNKNIGLLINAVGDEVTDVTIQFKFYINEKDKNSPVFRGFCVNSEVSTNEMLTELRKPLNERNYPENIHINKMYNLSDFIFKNNELPINFVDNCLQYVKLNSVKKGYELIYYSLDGNSGCVKKIDSELYDNPKEAIEKFRIIMNGLASVILDNCGILCETNA